MGIVDLRCHLLGHCSVNPGKPKYWFGVACQDHRVDETSIS